MNNLIIVHQSYQGSGDNFLNISFASNPELPVIWETCRRRLIFLDQENFIPNALRESDEVYADLDAEEFLIEVLCGLKSPLIGETEVFGQFKQWWTNLSNLKFKNKYAARIQQIYSVVKKIREESLCGLGSQSYGSLLRKKITELEQKSNQDIVIDFIGSGQLVEEIVPWIQKKWSYRIWCRNTTRVQNKEFAQNAKEVKSIAESSPLASLVVVAAPLTHDELSNWIDYRNENQKLSVFDFRHDSMSYTKTNNYLRYLHLDHFTSEVADQRQSINQKIQDAKNKIHNWKVTEHSRAQIRPFGWDDL